VCVVRDVEDWGRVELEPSELMRRTFELIDSVDVAIIELSEKGVGLGIEAGYAYACRVPVVALHRNGTDMSTTLAGIAHRVLPYAGDRLDVAAQAIRAIVRSD
jgi:2'-deoxynucleoside 5'-phosphate N-hydrolase